VSVRYHFSPARPLDAPARSWGRRLWCMGADQCMSTRYPVMRPFSCDHQSSGRGLEGRLDVPGMGLPDRDAIGIQEADCEIDGGGIPMGSDQAESFFSWALPIRTVGPDASCQCPRVPPAKAPELLPSMGIARSRWFRAVAASARTLSFRRGRADTHMRGDARARNALLPAPPDPPAPNWWPVQPDPGRLLPRPTLFDLGLAWVCRPPGRPLPGFRETIRFVSLMCNVKVTPDLPHESQWNMPAQVHNREAIGAAPGRNRMPHSQTGTSSVPDRSRATRNGRELGCRPHPRSTRSLCDGDPADAVMHPHAFSSERRT
jgi:hypothetical protein